MKIAILAPYSRPWDNGDCEGSGQNIFIRESAQALANYNHEVTVYRRSSRLDDKKIYQRAEKLWERTIVCGPKERLNRDEVYDYCNNTNILVEEFLEYDLIIANYWISEAWINKFKNDKIPKLFYFSHSTVFNPDRNTNINLKQLQAEINLMNKVFWLANSDREFTYISKYMSENKIFIVYPGITDINNFKIKKDVNRNKILYIGRKTEAKGYDLFYKLAKDNPKYDFIAVGRNNNFCSDLPNLKNYDFMPMNELVNLINYSKVVVLPSKYEHFGLVPFLSISLGVPVLATYTGGYDEIIKNNITGWLVKPDNYSELLNKFKQIISNSIVISTNEILKIENKFSWHNFAKNITDLVLNPISIFEGKIINCKIIPTLVNGNLLYKEKVVLPFSVHIFLKVGNKILLVNELRSNNNYKTRIVSGIANKGEKPQQTAERELLEELGMKANKLDLITSFKKDDVVCDASYYYMASDIEKVSDLKLDKYENIKKTVKLTYDELLQMIESKKIDKAEHILAIQLLKDFL